MCASSSETLKFYLEDNRNRSEESWNIPYLAESTLFFSLPFNVLKSIECKESDEKRLELSNC